MCSLTRRRITQIFSRSHLLPGLLAVSVHLSWATLFPQRMEAASVVFAGTLNAGVFKSIDGGASWNPVNAGLTNPSVPAIVIDPSNPAIVYAGTWGGVFKSLDGGASWSSASAGLPSDTTWMTLAIDPTNTSTLYAGVCPGNEAPICSNGGAFKSTDGGASWFPINTGLTHKLVLSFAIDPTQTLTIYASTIRGGLFKSTDGGATWSEKTVGWGGSLEPVVIDPQNTATLYVAGFIIGGVFKSTNAGTNWFSMNSGLPF